MKMDIAFSIVLMAHHFCVEYSVKLDLLSLSLKSFVHYLNVTRIVLLGDVNYVFNVMIIYSIHLSYNYKK